MADKNNDGGLDFEEILKLLKQLNADMDKKYVQTLFDVNIFIVNENLNESLKNKREKTQIILHTCIFKH